MTRSEHSHRKSAALLPLVPLGAAAAVAGCSGGGGPSSVTPAVPAGGATPVAQSTAPAVTSHATVTATLSIALPARGPKTATSTKRHPAYVSQGTAAVGVSVGPAGGPAPAAQIFQVPAPGPQPTTVTLPVTAPLGTDTVAVTFYDGVPSATVSPNALSQGSTTATVATGSTQFAVQAHGIAAGVVLRDATATSGAVLQNHGVDQTLPLTATPIDADGYAITGALATAVPLTAPAGVTLAPAALSSAAPVLLTYALKQSSIGGVVTAGLPLDTAAGSTDNFTLTAYQYLFVVTENTALGSGMLSVIDPLDRTVLANLPLTSSGPFAVAAIAGCPTGETMVVSTETAAVGTVVFGSVSRRSPTALAGTSATTAYTVPVPSSSAAPTTVDLTGVVAPRASLSQGVAASFLASDPNCGLYSANDTALTRYTGFPDASGSPIVSTGWNANSSIAYAGGTLYGTNVTLTAPGTTPSNETISLQSVPAAGGTVTNIGPSFSGTLFGPNPTTTDQGLEVGGTFVYEALTNCFGGYTIVAVPALTDTNVMSATPGVVFSDFAVGPDGTVYVATGTGVGGRQQSVGRSSRADLSEFTRRPDATVTSAAPISSNTGAAVGVSADGRFVAIAQSAGASGNPTVQIYAPPATPGGAPTAVGTPIPLTGALTQVSRAVFPR